MDGFNTRCETLKRKIVDNINESQLPIGVVYYIYKSLAHEIENTYYGALNGEAETISEEKKDDEVLNSNE
jgi:hypothetical protein